MQKQEQAYGMDKYTMIDRMPSEEEMKNIFASSCVESVAKRLGCTTEKAYARLKRAGLIEGYIYAFYDTLHTESRDNVTEDVLNCLQKKEGR